VRASDLKGGVAMESESGQPTGAAAGSESESETGVAMESESESESGAPSALKRSRCPRRS